MQRENRKERGEAAASVALRALPPLLKVFPLQGNEISNISKKQYGKEQKLSFLKRKMKYLSYSEKLKEKSSENGYKISTVTEPRIIIPKQTMLRLGAGSACPLPSQELSVKNKL
ncbi:MAG: hypothetical protein ACI4JJ_01555 [Huintestinicola sp.]